MNKSELSNIRFNLDLFEAACELFRKNLIPEIIENIRLFKGSAILEIAGHFEHLRQNLFDSLDGEGVDIAQWPKDLIDKYLLLMDKAKAVNDVFEQAAAAADSLNHLEALEHELQRL